MRRQHGLLLASDETHFEMGYVGLSRETLSNRLYAVSTESDADLERHQRNGSEPERDPISLVTESMTRSAAKDLAVNLAPAKVPDHDADYGIDL